MSRKAHVRFWRRTGGGDSPCPVNGNARESGQVLLGSELAAERLREAFPLPGACAALAAPSLQEPRLLEQLPDELTEASCAELAMLAAQSLSINQTVAAIAADYLVRLLLSRDLRRFATYVDLGAGSMRPRYITPESVAAVVGKSPHKLFHKPKLKTGA